MCAVNWWQLFDLHKSQGRDMPSNPAPHIKLATLLVKKPTRGITTPQHVHPLWYQVQDQSKFHGITTIL